MQRLFAEFLPERNPTSLMRFIGKNGFNLCKAVIVSIAFHIILVIVLYLSIQFSSDLVKVHNQDRSLYEVFAKNDQKNSQSQDMKSGVLAQMIEFEDILNNIRIQDSNLNQEDLSQLTNGLIDTLAALQKGYVSLEPSKAESIDEQIFNEIEGLELSSGTKLFKAPLIPGKKEIKFNILEKDKAEAFNKLSEIISAPKEDYNYLSQRVRINLQEGEFKMVPSGYFFRESPFEELLAQGADLFYIVTGFPNIYKREDQSKKESESKKPSANRFLDLKMLDVFLVEQSPQSMAASDSDIKTKKIGSDKLQIDEQNIRQILDDFMALPELEQLEKFKNDYLDRHAFNDPSLIEFTQEFTSNNLSSIMFDISDITSAFDYIEEIYFNKTLDHFFYKIWLEDPTSEVGVEFLLCIVNHIRFEKNGLFFLHNAYAEAKDFLSQKYQRTEMFNKRQKCFVIKDVYENLVRKLPSLGYDTFDEVLAFYEDVEKGVYNLLLDLGEEAKNIGLYELGRFAWDNEQHLEALEYWKNIDDSYSTTSLQKIRKVLSRNHSLPQTILDVNSSLNWNVYREQREFIARLVQFGKWKNRYKKE